MNNKPRMYLVFKIIGFVGAIAAIVGVVLTFSGFGDFDSNKFMVGSFLGTFGLMVASVGLAMGFSPEIAKIKAKSARYIQEENKEDLTAIASNAAEIMSEAVEATTSAVMDGMRKTMFCKHCGKKIDSDSRFCSFCGKEQ